MENEQLCYNYSRDISRICIFRKIKKVETTALKLQPVLFFFIGIIIILFTLLKAQQFFIYFQGLHLWL